MSTLEQTRSKKWIKFQNQLNPHHRFCKRNIEKNTHSVRQNQKESNAVIH